MSDNLRSKMIRLAATLPKGSNERKALLQTLAGGQTALDAASMSMRGERAGKHIEQMAKNLQQAMLRKDDPADIEKWMLRLFGNMLKEGMHPALDGWHSDLAREAYALGQKLQQRYR